MNSKERFFAAVKGEKADRIPVFPLLMSFAAKRHNINYKTFAQNGSALAEAQINIFEKYNIDAVSACSDAFRISADLGGDIIFEENSPPHLSQPLVTSEQELSDLMKADILKPGSRTADRVAAVRQMVSAIGNEGMVLGWVDMPFAEACSLCGVSGFMMMVYDEPELAHRILSFLTSHVINFAAAQIEAGAPMMGAGDAAASLISPEMYKEFVFPYEQMVCSACHKMGALVKLHICGDTSELIHTMAQLEADLFNVDHLVDFKTAANVYKNAGKAFKGNLNPVADMLQSTPEECVRKTNECIENSASGRYILSAGCEVPADVSDDVFNAFCSCGSNA